MNISSDDIIFRRAVIQLLDVENGNFEAARELLFLKNDIMELLRKQLVYIMQADEVKQAKCNKDSKVMNRIEQMNENNDEAFIRTSAEIAEELYDIMCDSADIPSADLLCLSFQIAGSLYYGLIKLNFSAGFMHEIWKENGQGQIKDIRHQRTLPLGKKPNEVMIFNLSEHKILLREKKYEMLNGDKIFYLSERFLKCFTDIDVKRKYQILNRAVNDINKKYPEDGLQQQMKTKSDLYYLFKEDQEFKVNKISDELYGDNPQKKQDFDEKMERYDMQYDSFTVEKEDTIKSLSYIDLKTENDIQIKIPIEEYMTKENIEVWEEPGGTKKITIKNIEQVTVQ